MKSKVYRHKKTDKLVNLEQLAIRGFAREFKSKLLAGQKLSLSQPEFSLVDYEFSKQLAEKTLIDSKISTNEKNPFNQESKLDSSVFSKWWSGKRYPDSKNRSAIDILFPGLAAKWLDGANYKNRMKMHLASLDLFEILSCNSKIDKPVYRKSKLYCEKCLSHARKKARWTLEAIHDDWKPIQVGYLGRFDVCITGPKNRGYIDANSKYSAFGINPQLKTHQEQLNYDLSLDERSLIGLNLPKEIVNSYQEENPFSIVIFLFLMVCLDFRAEAEYRNDLILDFMTALNCAGVLLYFEQTGLHTSIPDSTEEKIQKMLFHGSEYFHDEPNDLKDQLLDFERACNESNKKGREPADIVYPFTDFSCHAGYILSELFFDVLHSLMSPQDIKAFMEVMEEHSYSNSYEKTIIDDYMAQSDLQIFKSLEAARERYLKLFSVVGYSRKELLEQLADTGACPVNTKIGLDFVLQKLGVREFHPKKSFYSKNTTT